MDENEQAIIDWVNTFELDKPVTQLTELNDGNVLSDILFEMCPTYFEKDTLNKETTGNWALAAGNLRKLLRMLDGYFTTVLHKRVDTSHVNVNNIVKSNDIDEMMNLLELVVGVAVMCEDKNVFIPKIFELNDLSQAVLKGLVESVMGRAEDIEENPEGSGSGEKPAGVEDLHMSETLTEKDQLRVKEMVQHLQSERVRLLGEVTALEQNNESLKAQLAKSKERAQQKDQEREAVEGTDKSRVQALESLNHKLQSEIDDCKREQDLKIVECETLRHDLKAVMQRLEASREIQARLEMETHQQADELDIAKDKVAKLARAEQAVEKYQKKLEEMLDLKKQNKDLCDKMDQYLDQIHSLESANKGMTTLNKMVEQYKNKAVELETEKFEALSSVQMRDQQVAQLKADLDKAKEGRRLAQDECNGLRVQLEQLAEAAAVEAEEEGNMSPGKAAQHSLEEAYHTDSIPSLREKVKKLERDLRLAQAGEGLNEAGSSNSGSGVSGEGSSAAALHEVAIIQQELDDVRTAKKQREEQLMAAKKQLAEVQYELSKAQEAAAENERSADSTAQLKEVTQKLAETANTVRMLQEKLKEKESTINKVEQEKSKLENYTKRSLGTFKDKYMAVLQTLKEEKEDLQQKMRAQLDKAERNQDTWHREERLISSAVFELGVRIMDQKIQSQMQHTNAAYGSAGGATGSNGGNNGGNGGTTPGGDFLLSAVNSPLLTSSYNAGAGTYLNTQREALSRSTADAASRNIGTPNASSSGASAGTPNLDGPGRRLF